MNTAYKILLGCLFISFLCHLSVLILGAIDGQKKKENNTLKSVQYEAVSNGVAYWTNSPNGQPLFVWKKQPPTEYE